MMTGGSCKSSFQFLKEQRKFHKQERERGENFTNQIRKTEKSKTRKKATGKKVK